MKRLTILLSAFLFFGCKTTGHDASQTESIRGSSGGIAYLAFPSPDKKKLCLDKFTDLTYAKRERTIGCIATDHPDYAALKKEYPTLAEAIESVKLFEGGPSASEMAQYASWNQFVKLVIEKGQPYFGSPQPAPQPAKPAAPSKPTLVYKFCICDIESTNETGGCTVYGPNMAFESVSGRRLNEYMVWSDGTKTENPLSHYVCDGPNRENYCESHAMPRCNSSEDSNEPIIVPGPTF